MPSIVSPTSSRASLKPPITCITQNPKHRTQTHKMLPRERQGPVAGKLHRKEAPGMRFQGTGLKASVWVEGSRVLDLGQLPSRLAMKPMTTHQTAKQFKPDSREAPGPKCPGCRSCRKAGLRGLGSFSAVGLCHANFSITRPVQRCTSKPVQPCRPHPSGEAP